jgi:hypothetical protein
MATQKTLSKEQIIKRFSQKVLVNNPNRMGQLAARKISFGPWRRYAIAPIHTRGEQLCWAVWDAEEADQYRPLEPAIIRQALTCEQALEGLFE